jgi:L-threonylcarbamoyladenylate synthase
MKSEIVAVNLDDIDIAQIKKAARIIKDGGLVAFPTETVYGLGADAFNRQAVAKIFAVKNRPLYDPLIVHISDRKDLLILAIDVTDTALKLTEKFWPGPLTLVFKKSGLLPDIVTAGLDTVAIRMPADKIALKLIEESGTPIAAPSANIFGRPSPVTAQHVLEDLDGRIDLIIDGGKTLVGVESTVLDLTQNPPSILRPGGVTMETLKGVIKKIDIYRQDKVLAPGMCQRHYAPKAIVILMEGDSKFQIENIKDLAYEFELQGYTVGILAKEENKYKYNELNVKSFGPGDDLITCAANLYSVLREFDKDGTDIIISESVQEEGLGVAIMDRLRKAAYCKLPGEARDRCFPKF